MGLKYTQNSLTDNLSILFYLYFTRQKHCLVNELMLPLKESRLLFIYCTKSEISKQRSKLGNKERIENELSRKDSEGEHKGRKSLMQDSSIPKRRDPKKED